MIGVDYTTISQIEVGRREGVIATTLFGLDKHLRAHGEIVKAFRETMSE